jgi:diguanylate cyclase (GGDEF)-like protein
MTTPRGADEPERNSSPQRRSGEPTPTADDLSRQIRKQELDFTTIFEVATQINAHVLDDRHIESYLKFLTHYITTLTRGQFGLRKAFLFVQMDLDHTKIDMIPTSPKEAESAVLDADGDFGRWLQRQAAPFALDEAYPRSPAMPEADLLRRLGIVVAVPLLVTGSQYGSSLKGLLGVGPKLVGGPFTSSELRLFGLLANMAAVAIHNAQLHRKSIVDHLTQLYSRGHFDLHLATELSRAERYTLKNPESRRYVTLIMVDIDHFKSFNDTHGHLAGDRILRSVARGLQRAVRRSDIVARYGGEEFVLIAVETNKQEGSILAERLRKVVAQSTVTIDGVPRHVTASFGVANYPDDARTPQELIALADAALYRAKNAGRNRICLNE